MSVSSKRVGALIALLAVLTAALALPGAGMAAGKKPKPSLQVVGFGINWLFAAKGTTVKSEKLCDEIVAADTPVGPPQQVYLTVFVRATGIPKKAPVQFKDSFPFSETSTPAFTEPVPFSRIYGTGTFAVGSPPNAKDLFYEPIVSFNSEYGPSAEEFNGEYSYTASVKFGGRTLRSTAKVKVACAMLR